MEEKLETVRLDEDLEGYQKFVQVARIGADGKVILHHLSGVGELPRRIELSRQAMRNLVEAWKAFGTDNG